MIMYSSRFILLSFYQVYSLYHTFESCFYSLIEKSQNCDNNRITYVTAFGKSGLSSEFNCYFVPAIVRSALTDRRIVILTKNNDWEYNCQNKLEWGCYFNLPCEDSITHVIKAHDYSYILGNPNCNPYEIPSLKSLIGKMIPQYQQSSIQEIFRGEACSKKNILDRDPNPLQKMFIIAANYIYHFNGDTKHEIELLNDHYKDLFDHSMVRDNGFVYYRYVALHIRRTDKISEYPSELWRWLNTTENIVKTVMPYVLDNDINKILIVSDDCHYVKELYQSIYVGYGNKVVIRSTCFKNADYRGNGNVLVQSNRHIARSDHKKNRHHHQNHSDYSHAITLLADLELLRQSEHFFGFFDSNIARMVAKLRALYLPAEYTHALGSDAYNRKHYLKITNWFT